MATTWTDWQWSVEYNRYYKEQHDAQGQRINTEWAPDSSEPRTSEPQANVATHQDDVSGSSPSHEHYELQAVGQSQEEQAPAPADSDPESEPEPPPVVRQLRPQDPSREDEELDPSYKRVAPRDQKKFFAAGRVFAVLWTEPAGGTPRQPDPDMSDAFSVVRYGGRVHAEIRRFIVIKAYAWHSICVPIASYGHRGVINRPDAEHHAIAYTSVQPPQPMNGENINRHAIKIDPRGNQRLTPQSRINFAKFYTVEHNVKVKQVGKVDGNFMEWIKYYYNESAQMD